MIRLKAEKNHSKYVSDKLMTAIKSFSLADIGDHILVGFSGGKDSVVLLSLLKSHEKDLGTVLSALHVNHGIRGDEADRDEQFCRALCQRLGVPFYSVKVDAVSHSKQTGKGLEEAARELRYSELYKTANKIGANKIATAHTSSDNLETVIFNLTRGASADGLKGIPPKRDNIIRPLILCSTEDILRYAEEKKLPFATDSTNLDTDYSRNNIRHNVVPYLKKINPNIENTVLNTCACLTNDALYLDSEAEKHVGKATPRELALLSPAILGRVLLKKHAAFCETSGSSSALSHKHIEDMADLITDCAKTNGGKEKRLSLPDKTDLVVTPSSVYFEKSRRYRERLTLNERKIGAGLTEFTENGRALLITDDKNEINTVLSKNVYKNSIHTIVKKDMLADTIIVRSKAEGDVFKFSNMTKKVRKMMNEAKLPSDEREILPMLCDESGIFWIPGFPLRDDYRPNLNEDIFHIYYLKQE